MTRTMIVLWAACLCMWVEGFAADTTPASQPAEPNLADLAKAATPSLVRVEYTLQFDKGEAPRAAYSGRYGYGGGAENLIAEERPMEMAGFVLSPTKVVTSDPIIEPRFIKSIQVRCGKQLVDAKVISYARGQSALFLELEKPLKEAKPLAFVANAAGPFFGVSYYDLNGQWTVLVAPLTKTLAVPENGKQFNHTADNILVIDAQGKPVAVSMQDETPTDDSWKGSPEAWAVVTAAEMDKMLKDLQEKCDAGMLRVALSFRSPPKDTREEYRSSGQEEEGTEKNVLGFLVDGKTIVVAADLSRQVTARLEKIRVYPAKGQPVEAKFQATLSDFGVFLATLDKPIDGAIPVNTQELIQLKGTMLLTLDITLQGESRVCHYGHSRLAGIQRAWKRQLYPEIIGPEEKTVLFDAKGAIIAAPISHRSKATVEERYSGSRPMLTPVVMVKTALGDLAANSDKSNVPLSEEEENRTAWTGMVLQPLDKELARVNNVSEQTQDGSTGAMVSYVYPGSPADKAGIKQGFILLRLQFKDQPKPLDVRVEGDRFGGRPFPWNELDRIPDEYYERIPTPWPSAADEVCKKLTDMGFGKPYTAEFFNDGKVIKKDFTIEQSPAHYESATRFKAAGLGLTVRNLTYELRRYFQKEAADPGVIISKVEAGGKASVAGVKPYEIITAIDGQPVNNVKDFEKLMKTTGELKLSVSRMTKGRQVKVNMTGSTTKPTTDTASAPADDGE